MNSRKQKSQMMLRSPQITPLQLQLPIISTNQRMKSLLDATNTLQIIKNLKAQLILLLNSDLRDNLERAHHLLSNLNRLLQLWETIDLNKAQDQETNQEAFQIIILRIRITHQIRKIIIISEASIKWMNPQVLLNTTNKVSNLEIRKVLPLDQLILPQVLQWQERLENNNI